MKHANNRRVKIPSGGSVLEWTDTATRNIQNKPHGMRLMAALRNNKPWKIEKEVVSDWGNWKWRESSIGREVPEFPKWTNRNVKKQVVHGAIDCEVAHVACEDGDRFRPRILRMGYSRAKIRNRKIGRRSLTHIFWIEEIADAIRLQLPTLPANFSFRLSVSFRFDSEKVAYFSIWLFLKCNLFLSIYKLLCGKSDFMYYESNKWENETRGGDALSWNVDSKSLFTMLLVTIERCSCCGRSTYEAEQK